MLTFGIGKTSAHGMTANKGDGFTPYHTPHKRTRKVDYETKEFIAWDGEGINLRGPGKPQSYVLFGSSKGHISSTKGLSTFECLEHIIATGQENPGAIHVGFAFNYDANMLVQSLAPVTLGRLHKNGWVRLKRQNGDVFTVTVARGKFFRVTKQKPEYDSKHNPTAKTTVQIYDIFSFFACSFIKAYEDMIGSVPDVIRTGKAARGAFSLDEFDEVQRYWDEEIQLLRELAEELRRRVYNAGLRINQWHGPGALATYSMREHKIKEHMAVGNDEVRLAARHGYAGGRFELFKLGRITRPVWSVDINSAYPHAISQLPSLSDGHWVYVENPTKIRKFGIYHVRLKQGTGFDHAPGPVFHRDSHHNITFPWVTDGWYWSPETTVARRSGAEVMEGWEFHGGDSRPFAFIPDMYEQRREWKRRGISAQIALKLCMNSMYGKLAQRVGWDEQRQQLPPFHQLEWAGWVTSYVRARLFNVMAQIPYDDLVAVETDGIYTTLNPTKLNMINSVELGEWEIGEYDEIMYVQSGLAWLHNDKGWTQKRRGLDPCREGHHPEDCHCEGTFSLNACRSFLTSLHAAPDRSTPWTAYDGRTTRFVGLGHALASRQPTHERHCVWETNKREILPGMAGKRIHVPDSCRGCADGGTAYDTAHSLVVNSRAVWEPRSMAHDIPWERADRESTNNWRDYDESEYDEVTVQYV